MDLGDRVVYYTHVASEDDHSVKDQLAFVLGVVDDATLDVMVVPPGGPIRFERISQFDADNPYNTPGGSYWREVGSEPPDFAEPFAYYNRPEWTQMIRRQQKEYSQIPSENPNDLWDRHVQERSELWEKLKAKEGPASADEPRQPYPGQPVSDPVQPTQLPATRPAEQPQPPRPMPDQPTQRPLPPSRSVINEPPEGGIK